MPHTPKHINEYKCLFCKCLHIISVAHVCNNQCFFLVVFFLNHVWYNMTPAQHDHAQLGWSD